LHQTRLLRDLRTESLCPPGLIVNRLEPACRVDEACRLSRAEMSKAGGDASMIQRSGGSTDPRRTMILPE
jgi:hypothetical protein